MVPKVQLQWSKTPLTCDYFLVAAVTHTVEMVGCRIEVLSFIAYDALSGSLAQARTHSRNRREVLVMATRSSAKALRNAQVSVAPFLRVQVRPTSRP